MFMEKYELIEDLDTMKKMIEVDRLRAIYA